MDLSKEDDRRTSSKLQRSRTDSEDTASEDASREEPRYGKTFMKRLTKQLKSPSLYQKGAMKLAEKVKLRKPLCARSRESLTSDEIIYPLSYESDEVKAEKKKKMSFEDVKMDFSRETCTTLSYDTCARVTKLKGIKVPRLPHSKMPIVKGNKDNDNNLLINNMPFWWSANTSDIMDEELIMNANVIIDAIENRLKLTTMPDVEIILDPVEDVSKLQERDAMCFTKDIIFGNTVRSMVNLNELSLRELHERSSRKFRKKNFPFHPSKEDPELLEFTEPRHCTFYNREDRSFMLRKEFTPTKRGRYSRECDWF